MPCPPTIPGGLSWAEAAGLRLDCLEAQGAGVSQPSWGTVLAPSPPGGPDDDAVLQAAIDANAVSRKPVYLTAGNEDGTGFVWKKQVVSREFTTVAGTARDGTRVTLGGPYSHPGIICQSSFTTADYLADPAGLDVTLQGISFKESPLVASYLHPDKTHLKFLFRYDSYGPDPQSAYVLGLSAAAAVAAEDMPTHYGLAVGPYGTGPDNVQWTVVVNGSGGTILRAGPVLIPGQTYAVEVMVTAAFVRLVIDGTTYQSAQTSIPARWDLHELTVGPNSIGTGATGRLRNVEIACQQGDVNVWVGFPLVVSEWDGPCFKFYHDAGAGYTFAGWGAVIGGPYRGPGTGSHDIDISRMRIDAGTQRVVINLENSPSVQLSALNINGGQIGIRSGGYSFDPQVVNLQMLNTVFNVLAYTNAGYGRWEGLKLRGAECAAFTVNDYAFSLSDAWIFDSRRGIIVDGANNANVELSKVRFFNENSPWTDPLLTLYQSRNVNVFGGWIGKPMGGDLIRIAGGGGHNFYGVRYTFQNAQPGDVVFGQTGAVIPSNVFGGTKEGSAAPWTNDPDNLLLVGAN